MESKIEINSLLEFIEYIEVMPKLEEEKEPLRKYYYRGENNVFPKRVPSIYRSNENKPIYQRLVNEGSREYYLELFEELGWSISNFGHKMFEQMIEIQHYGAVTNVLDVSINPLVALFFACYGSDKTDGKVYVYSVNEDDEEHYFNRNIAIMTALNFIDRRLINSFISFFKEIIEMKGPYHSSEYGIFFKNGDFLSEFTPEDIMNRITTLMETGEFEYYRDFLDNPESKMIWHLGDDGDGVLIDAWDVMNEWDSFRIPFTVFRYDYNGENAKYKTIFPDNRYENDAIDDIQSFISKLYDHGDSTKEYFESLKYEFDLPLDVQKEQLIIKIKRIMVDFLKELNKYSGLDEKIIYPFEAYKIINKSYIVKASKINERIKNQKGAFIIPSYISTVGKNIEQVQSELNSSINNHVGLIEEFTIPSASKAIILQQLKLIGIDEGFIYPEIANIAKAVLEKYKVY